MKRKTTSLLSTVVLILGLSTTLSGQLYGDLFLGLHPQLVDEGSFTAHVNLAVGLQPSQWVGYGLNYGAMVAVTTSTSSSFSILGLQYRLMDNQHRFYAKAEVGSLVEAAYTTDGFQEYTYEPDFDPYYRVYFGYRFGRVSLGMNYTHIRPFLENISEYDDTLNMYIPTGQLRTRNTFHDVQIYVGISLDKYPVVKRK